MKASCLVLSICIASFLAGCSAGKSAYSTIYQAAEADDAAAIRSMIASGHEVDEVDPTTGNTGMHAAAYSNRVAAAIVLLEADADPMKANTRGNTSFDLAVPLANNDVLRLMLQQIGPLDPTVKQTLIDTAIKSGNAEGETMLRAHPSK